MQPSEQDIHLVAYASLHETVRRFPGGRGEPRLPGEAAPRHRRVVFMRAPGVDARDAAARAEWALRRAIRANPAASLTDEGRNGTGAAMPVVDLMEVGMAAGNGYLWTRPTVKTFREHQAEGDHAAE